MRDIAQVSSSSILKSLKTATGKYGSQLAMSFGRDMILSWDAMNKVSWSRKLPRETSSQDSHHGYILIKRQIYRTQSTSLLWEEIWTSHTASSKLTVPLSRATAS